MKTPLLISDNMSTKQRAVIKAAEVTGAKLQFIVGELTMIDVVNDAFELAKQGNKVIVFIDNIQSFSPRSQIAITCMTKQYNAQTAQHLGVQTEEGVYMLQSPLCPLNYAPADKIEWILGCSSDAVIDASFAMRVAPYRC